MKEKMQEVFTTVRDHLLKQMAQAKCDSRCRYLDDEGMKCAVGCLIKPEHYTRSMEGVGISTMMALLDRANAPESAKYLWNALVASLGYEPDGDMLKLMRQLQYLHDESQPCEWEAKLKVLAVDFGLAY